MFETKYRIMRNLDRQGYKPFYIQYKLWFMPFWTNYKDAYGDIMYFQSEEYIESLVHTWLSPKKSKQEFVKNVE